MDKNKREDYLLKIADNLLDKDVENIKFLYSKEIGDGHLEKIKTPIELILTLKRCMLLSIDNYDDFIKVLISIGRNDLAILLSKAQGSPEITSRFSVNKEAQASPEITSGFSANKDYYIKEMDKNKREDYLLKIADNLLDNDVENIKFLYSKGIGDGHLEKIKTPIELILTLKRRMLLSIDNYDDFIKVLISIGRNDLAILLSNMSSNGAIRRTHDISNASFMELALPGEQYCKNGDCRIGVEYFEAAIKVSTEDLKTLSAVYS